MIATPLRGLLFSLSVLAAGCLFSPVSSAAESQRRVLFDFDTTELSADWVTSGQITLASQGVPDTGGIEGPCPAGKGLLVRTDQGGGLYCHKSIIPPDWRPYRELVFWVYRSPNEAAQHPKSTIEVRIVEADVKAGFSHRLEVDHTGWMEVSLPLRWFCWGEGRVPRWDRIDRLGFRFYEGAEVLIDTISLIPGEPAPANNTDLTADDLLAVAFLEIRRGLSTQRSDYSMLVTDVANLDKQALGLRLTEAAQAVQEDFPFLDKPSTPSIFMVFSSREAYESFPVRLAEKLGADAGKADTDGCIMQGVAATFFDEDQRKLHSVCVATFLENFVTQSARLTVSGDWVHAGIAKFSQMQFYPQKNFGEVVLREMRSPGARQSLEELCNGEKIAASQHWQAVTLIDMLRTQETYRAAFPRLFEAFREAGSTDLGPHLMPILKTDWQKLTADWQVHCEKTYGEGPSNVVTTGMPEPVFGGRSSATYRLPVSVGWDEGWTVYRYSPDNRGWESFKSPVTPLPPLAIVGVGPDGAVGLDPYAGFSGWYFDLNSKRWREVPTSPITPYSRSGTRLHGVENVAPAALNQISFVEVPVIFAGSRLIVLVHSVSKTVHGAVFDTRTWRWSGISDPPIALRFRYPHAVIGDKLVIWGGYPNYLQDGAVFDLTSRTWSKIPPAPVKFVYGMVHAQWRDQLVVVGGRQEDDQNTHYAGATYDPASQTWTTIPRAPFPLGENLTCTVSGDQLFLWSGRDMGTGGAIYDFSTRRWKKVSAAPIPARSLAHALPVAEKIVVWGGWDGQGPSRTDGAVYDLKANSWAKLPDMPLGIPGALQPGW